MKIPNEPLTLLLYGLSGSGKGTQAEMLEKHLKEAGDTRSVLHIETGERLRSFSKKIGRTQKMTADVLASGGLLPSFLPVHLWTTAFVEEFFGTEHLILDGLARRVVEAPILDGALWFYGRGDYQVIVFDLSLESAKERLQERSRGDDKQMETILSRFAWYEENVKPAIEWFEKQGRPVHRIDAEPSIEAIHQVVLGKLGLV